MPAMKRWIIAALGAFASTAAMADYTDEPPVYTCDAAASRIEVWFKGREMPFEVDPAKLASELKALPSRASKALTPGGSAYRLPGATRSQRCGRLTLRLRSAFLNAHPDGELGVFEFPSVEILDGAHVVLPRTGLAICDDPPSRWAVSGRCPQDFATGIDVTAATASAPARVRLARTHNTVDAAVGRETGDRRVP